MTEFVEVKTEDLLGAALDWAVAKVEAVEDLVLRKGRPAFERDFDPDCWADDEDMKLFKCWRFYTPSTDWGQGGPLIHKHGCDLNCIAPENAWEANCWDSELPAPRLHLQEGETPLIAACRAIVLASIGPVVSIPRELLP